VCEVIEKVQLNFIIFNILIFLLIYVLLFQLLTAKATGAFLQKVTKEEKEKIIILSE
jgi:hypothetical protein